MFKTFKYVFCVKLYIAIEKLIWKGIVDTLSNDTWWAVTQIAMFYEEYGDLLRKMPILQLMVMNLQNLFSKLFLLYYILIIKLLLIWVEIYDHCY